MQQVILEQLQTLRSEQRAGFDSIRAEFNQRIDRLVTSEAFTAEQRRVDDRLAQLGRELGEERAIRKAEFEEVARRGDRIVTNVKWLAGSLVLPVGFFLYGVVQDAGGM